MSDLMTQSGNLIKHNAWKICGKISVNTMQSLNLQDLKNQKKYLF